MRTHARYRAAFTLIEVIISLAMLVLLSGVLMGFLWNLAKDRRAVVNILQVQRTADVLFDRLASDLTSAVATSGSGAGINGRATSLTIVSRGVFVTAPGATAQQGDAQTMTVEFIEGTGEITLVRNAGASGAGSPEILSDRIAQVRFRYHDGSSWRTSFNSQSAANLPVAVEVAVWFLSPGADPIIPIPEDPSLLTEEEVRELEEQYGPNWMDEILLSEEEEELKPEHEREPDRIRVLIVPDGPSGTWSAFGSAYDSGDFDDGGSE